MGVEKSIQVKIKALVEGVKEVLALVDAVQQLSASGGGGGAVAVEAGASGEVQKLAAEVRKLGAEIKNLQPGKLTQLINAAGNVGALLSGVSRYREAVGALSKAKSDVGGVITRVTARAQEFGATVGSKVSGAVEGLTARLPGLAGGLGGAGAGLTAIAGAGVAAATGIGIVVAGVLAFVAALTLLSAAIPVVINLLQNLFDRGVDYNSQLEQTRLGIAAVISSLAELRGADGQRLEGADSLNASFELAGAQLAKLKVDAINTTATFEQIGPAFQAAIGPGLRAGLTLDQVRETTVKIVQAAGALGIPMNQVNQEVRAILEGTINEDARLAKVLGISNEMVKTWKEQGKVQEELNKRLEKFAVAGERAANTLDGLKSNLQEAFNVFAGDATDQAFETLKRRMQQLLPQLFDFKNARLDAAFQPLSDLLDDIFTRGINIAADFINFVVSGVKSISRFVGENRTQVAAVLKVAEEIVRIVGGILGHVLKVTSASIDWRSALASVHGVLLLIQGIVIALAPLIRQATAALAFFLATLQASPAFQGLALLARVAGAKPAGATEIERAVGALEAEKAQLTNAELRRRGFTSDISVDVPPGSPGGKKGGGGGGGRQSQVRELTQALEEAKLETALARLRVQAELVRQNIEASVEAVRNGLEDSILSIGEAFRLQSALADKFLSTELERIKAEEKAARDRRDLAVKNLDPQLTGKERGLAIAVEDEKRTRELVQLDGERKKLVEETADKKAELVRQEALEREALRATMADVEDQLDALSRSGSVRAEAVSREIEARFKETRERLEAEVRQGTEGAAEALERLNKLIGGLTDRAKFEEIHRDVQARLGELRDLEELLEIGVEQGQIKSRDAAKRRLELELEYKRALGDTIAGLAEIARRTGDPALAAAVRELQIEWAKLGKVIDETAKRIDDSIRGSLEENLVGVITRTKSLGEAWRSLAQTIINELARIVASQLIERVFGGLLNTGSGNSIGGILSRILGTATPKPSSTPAPAGSGIENIPLIIKNFSGSVSQGLGGLRNSSEGLRGDVTAGLGQVNSGLGTAVGLLGNLVSFQAAQAAAAVASTITSIVKTIAASSSAGAAKAEGGLMTGPGTGTSDSIWARLSNGEYVIREWATKRVGPRVLEFINNFGELPAPRFAFGGLVGELGRVESPMSVGGDTYNVRVEATINTKDRESFKGSEATIFRDIGRAAQQGVRRAKTRPK